MEDETMILELMEQRWKWSIARRTCKMVILFLSCFFSFLIFIIETVISTCTWARWANAFSYECVICVISTCAEARLFHISAHSRAIIGVQVSEHSSSLHGMQSKNNSIPSIQW